MFFAILLAPSYLCIYAPYSESYNSCLAPLPAVNQTSVYKADSLGGYTGTPPYAGPHPIRGQVSILNPREDHPSTPCLPAPHNHSPLPAIISQPKCLAKASYSTRTQANTWNPRDQASSVKPDRSLLPHQKPGPHPEPQMTPPPPDQGPYTSLDLCPLTWAATPLQDQRPCRSPEAILQNWPYTGYKASLDR